MTNSFPQANDWVIFDMKVGQIKEIRDTGGMSFSDGFFETVGYLADRCRPLTLRNKNIAETFDIIYRRLKELDGNAGFNYPEIFQHFVGLSLKAIDEPDKTSAVMEEASKFITLARDYTPIIDGVRLFRRAA